MSNQPERTLYWDGHNAVEDVHIRYDPATHTHHARYTWEGKEHTYTWQSSDPDSRNFDLHRTYEEAASLVRARIVRGIEAQTKALTALEADVARRGQKVGGVGMKPYYERGGIQIFHGDCREVLPTLQVGSVDVVLTDPPYLTGDSGVTHSLSGVSARVTPTTVVGSPWGYSLDWMDLVAALNPSQWVIFGNYRMLGGLCSTLDRLATLSCVFAWRKSNAPPMMRNVPRMDAEFIAWARRKDADCRRMGQFRSMVLDVPMPQAGCMADERLVERGTGRALHPTQKPIAVVRPFVDRVSNPGETILDCFLGTGTTLRAAMDDGRNAIGIEIEERYCEIAARRLQQDVLDFGEGEAS